jgi:putative ABC transport system substrate-binding protein
MTRRGRVLVVAVLLGVLAAPLAAGAQGRVYRLGYLAPGTPPRPDVRAGEGFLVESLRELGYVEGRNLEVDRRYAGGRIERLPALAAELVGRRPDAIVAPSPVAVETVRNATKTIPTVMIFAAADPVELGMVASLARPGGNITGVALSAGTTLTGKRLELLKEVIPRASRIALLTTEEPGARAQVKEAEQAAAQLRVKLVAVEARGRDYERAFATMASERPDALCVLASVILNNDRTQIIGLASRHRLPAIYQWREHVDAGGDLRRPDLQGREPGGPARRAAYPVRAGSQPQDRQGARDHDTVVSARAGRPRDPVDAFHGRVASHGLGRGSAPRRAFTAWSAAR